MPDPRPLSRAAVDAARNALLAAFESLLLADADAAESEGPWKAKPVPMSQTVKPQWQVSRGGPLAIAGLTEPEASAVANALNRVASRATTTEGER